MTKMLLSMWKMLKKGTCECTKACICLVVGVGAGALLQHHYHLTEMARECMSFLLK